MEKPYLIYNSGKALMVYAIGQFIVTPLLVSVMYAASVVGVRLLAITGGLLSGGSVLMGYYFDRRAKR